MGIDGIGRPKTIVARSATLAKPKRGVVIEIFGVGQPASLVKVVAGGAANGVVLRRPGNFRQKLRDDKTVGRLPQMLPESPPAEVVGPFQVLVGALKERDIRRQKVPRFGVGKGVFVKLLVLGV